MTLSADQCSLYAQVLPVFTLIVMAESTQYVRGPRAGRVDPRLALVIPFVLGCLGSYLSLVSSDDGASGLIAWLIETSGTLCIGMVALLGALIPYRDQLARRALSKLTPSERRAWLKSMGADEPPSEAGPGKGAKK